MYFLFLQAEMHVLRKHGELHVKSLEAANVKLQQAKDAIDSTGSAEAMVERLSEKNITLEDKARRLQDELGDMQSLLDMNDEFEEAHVLSERQLGLEMQQAISRLTELENSMFMMATHNQVSYDNDVTSFFPVPRPFLYIYIYIYPSHP